MDVVWFCCGFCFIWGWRCGAQLSILISCSLLHTAERQAITEYMTYGICTIIIRKGICSCGQPCKFSFFQGHAYCLWGNSVCVCVWANLYFLSLEKHFSSMEYLFPNLCTYWCKLKWCAVQYNWQCTWRRHCFNTFCSNTFSSSATWVHGVSTCIRV